MTETEDNLETLQALEENLTKIYANFHPKKTKKGIIPMFPYPSGKLHMGHVRNYVFCDVLARFYHIRNDSHSLHCIGYDSFGMPAENAAKENNMATENWIKQCIENMDMQLKDLHILYDWSRSANTSNVEYFSKTQDIIKMLLKHKKIYRSTSFVNWDPVDKTVLANEQVIDGKGWRSGVQIEKRMMESWKIRLSEYAEKLYNGLDETCWPKSIISIQKKWLGKKECFVITLKTNKDDYIEVILEKPEDLSNCIKISISIEHEIALKTIKEKNIIIKNTDKHEINTEIFCINPINGEKIYVYISLLNNQYVKNGIAKLNSQEKSLDKHAEKIKHLLEKKEIKKTILYNLKDWSFSRQRAWGCPINMFFCKECGWQFYKNVEIDKKRLSLSYEELKDTEINVECKKCKKECNVEKETMDTFIDSSWYFLYYINKENIEQALEKLPLLYYIGGIEHANLHLIYSRAIIMMLEECFDKKTPEPFQILVTQGTILCESYFLERKYLHKEEYSILPDYQKEKTIRKVEKMSKSKKNTINPEEIMSKNSSSSTRLMILMDYPIEATYTWEDKKIETANKITRKILNYIQKKIENKSLSQEIEINKDIAIKTIAMYEKNKINNVIAFINKMINDDCVNLKTFLILIYPIVPAIADHFHFQQFKTYIYNETGFLRNSI